VGRDPFHQTRLLKAPLKEDLNIDREVAATASLGNLDQGLITLRVMYCFLVSTKYLRASTAVS